MNDYAKKIYEYANKIITKNAYKEHARIANITVKVLNAVAGYAKYNCGYYEANIYLGTKCMCEFTVSILHNDEYHKTLLELIENEIRLKKLEIILDDE